MCSLCYPSPIFANSSVGMTIIIFISCLDKQSHCITEHVHMNYPEFTLSQKTSFSSTVYFVPLFLADLYLSHQDDCQTKKMTKSTKPRQNTKKEG